MCIECPVSRFTDVMKYSTAVTLSCVQFSSLQQMGTLWSQHLLYLSAVMSLVRTHCCFVMMANYIWSSISLDREYYLQETHTHTHTHTFSCSTAVCNIEKLVV